MKKYCILLAASLLLSLSGCKKEMPKNFAAMPDVLSDDELNIAENEPSYKCIESHYMNGKLEEKKERLYDEHDHMISSDEFNVDTGETIPAMHGKHVNEYDVDGNWVKGIWYGPDEKTVDRVFINTYDENGNRTSIAVYYNYDGQPKKYLYYEMKYDGHGNETEWIKAKADNGIHGVCKYSYEFDDKGNITKKTEDDSSSKHETEEYTYTYDDDGNMLTENRRRYSKKETLFESSRKCDYDSRGNLIREESSFSDGRADKVISYEYDAHNRKIRETDGYSETLYEYETVK
ncbi:hypothetical protein [Ruminococcus flavefaciens]|uniref:Uncharacterized protein n=2 Tax=Ruminococcus flavefaciens TaxID=1265 RepID=W7UFP7_RUMFL|nr:hypothetical protein [Ruminococcus flavefaciens]EWM52743.1 hypothetical protein RF007C_14015 [Ruminococcus flavefaciens 007c]